MAKTLKHSTRGATFNENIVLEKRYQKRWSHFREINTCQMGARLRFCVAIKPQMILTVVSKHIRIQI